MGRKKSIPRCGAYSHPCSSLRIPTTNIFINSQSKHPSSSHSEPMARTKTVTRRPAREQVPHPAIRPSSSRGKRPLVKEEDEEEEVPVPPPTHSPPLCSNRGNDYRYLLHPIRETYDPNPCSYKDVFASFPPEEFDEEWFAFQGWLPLFDIKTRVYPNLVREFYASMMYHKSSIMSYVKGRAIMIDKAKLSGVLGYTKAGSDIARKWEKSLNLSYEEALACVCENPSALVGISVTHKSLSPIHAQLHHIVNHILLPQSGPYQRVSFSDTLMLFELIMKVLISFGYLMMHHMYDCIRNEKLITLSYGIFFTKIFESYCIDFHDEPYEESYSQLKGGGAVKRIVKRDLAAIRRAMEEEETAKRASNKASSSRSSDSSQIKLLLHVVEELMAKVAFLVTQMHQLSKGFKSTTHKSTSTFEKATERIHVHKRYVDKLKDDHMFSDAEEEEEENEEDESEPSDA
ncbi:hypothetical protein PIB30_058899 [Stylosanthes scabra]|uniref:Putative plant transposon protein domain-containing protein n=1 Tax=Stylosanthes scabra TaxID=79078 RepID=A0ABU6QKF0_9FABA|nr:hypothetical protein [Stylosanthes scabra]